MAYNPQIHNRKSIRLKGYNYSQEGLYFITICTQNRECFFGEIGGDVPICTPEMTLNNAGKMIAKWYNELQNKFPDVNCHEMIIMPNHFHCIIEIVGADLRVCPNSNLANPNLANPNLANPNLANPNLANPNLANPNLEFNNTEGEHEGSPLFRVIQWFKTMTTNEYIRGVKTLGWQPFNGKLWQRNYWEHIIRNENEYNRISKYIINNPRQWYEDKLKK